MKLELSRKEDFIGMHGRWPTVQYYKVGVEDGRHAAGDPAARLQRHGAVPQELRQRSAASSSISARTSRPSSTPVYTNRTVSGNFRGPEFPQGFFGIQSMMDDVAYKLKMDPVEFILKNMTRKSRDEAPYTNYTLDECIRRGAEAFDWKKRWRPQPGSDAGPIKRGAGVAFMAFRAGARPEQRRDPRRRERASTRVFVGVTDVGAGAKTTMGLIAAEALGVPLSQVDGRLGRHRSLPVLGRRVRQPHDDHDRLRRGRSGARSEEADRREGHADRRRRARSRRRRRIRRSQGKVRNAFGAHFVEVEVDTELGRVRVTKYVAVHDCGRIINPLDGDEPDQGRRDAWASAWRCTRICSTTGAAGSR